MAVVTMPTRANAWQAEGTGMPGLTAVGTSATLGAVAQRDQWIRVGPFSLSAPIGSGGMGTVWNSVHEATGIPVAVKVITSELARDPEYQRVFRDEVRAVARLDHPGVVLVFDHGLIPEAAAERSGGQLVAGSPYLAMERITGGSLRDRPAPMRWSEVRHLALQLLDALGHAHARDMIHLDIKPTNVLVGSDWDLRSGVKLVDFGLAQALQSTGQTRGRGTPHYMAPEQCAGRWRAFGPWTDLYALGCLLFELVAGRPPFRGRTFAELAMQHQHDPLPPLEPRRGLTLPPRFEGWLRRLLARLPSERFRRAADASWALLQLDPSLDPVHVHDAVSERPPQPPSPDSQPIPGPVARWPETTSSTPLPVSDPNGVSFAGLEPEPGTATSTREDPQATWDRPSDALPPAAPPPMPRSWRSGPNVPFAARSMQLVGAGLGLFGLRTIPMVGRRTERDLLWTALWSTSFHGDARVLTLEGPAGVGKSRLAAWVAERGHEVGAADVLTARHSQVGGPHDGLLPMLARALRCVGLPTRHTEGLIYRELRLLGAEAAEVSSELAPMLAPPATGAAPPCARAPALRFGTILETLRLLSRRRPLVVVLEDVQYSEDALAFLEYVLSDARRARLPALFVLTVRSEALAEETAIAPRLERLAERPDVQRVRVGALPSNHQSTLVRSILGLQGDLAGQVEERAAGNPMMAVRLVGDWVARRVLIPGRVGFVLAPGAHAELPESLRQIWDRSLALGLRMLPPWADQCLEVAAALGHHVDLVEWRAACGHAGLAPPDGIVDVMSGRGLLLPDGLGFQMAHAMIRETLEQHARRAGRWADHNRACAAMLEELADPAVGPSPERLGRHLMEAGETARAVGHVIEGASRRLWRSDPGGALVMLARAEEGLRHLDGTAVGPDHGRIWVLRAAACQVTGELDDAARWARQAAEMPDEPAWFLIRADALLQVATIERLRGQLEDAAELASRARVEYERLGDRRGAAACLVELGWAATIAGQRDVAETHFRDALVAFRVTRDAIGEADAYRALGQIAAERGDPERARQLIRLAKTTYRRHRHRLGVAAAERALAYLALVTDDLDQAARRFGHARRMFDSLGNRLGVASALRGDAEVARRRGDQVAAETACRQVIAIQDAAGWRLDPEARVALSGALIGQGRFAAAREVLEVAGRILPRPWRLRVELSWHLHHCACAEGDRALLELHLAEAEALLDTSPPATEADADILRVAAQRARSAGNDDLAARLKRLALAVQRRLERAAEIDAIQTAAWALPPG